MTDPRDRLGDELRDLGRRLRTPDPPDVRDAVRRRLSGPWWRRWGPWWRRWRRRLGLLAAVVLVGGLAAAPPVRAGVTDLLRFAGVSIGRTPVARPSATPSPVATGSATLADARRLAPFPIGVPERLGAPDRVLLVDSPPRVVSLLYAGGALRLDEFHGKVDVVFAKTVPDVEWVDVGGQFAVWLGRPHDLVYVDRAGVAHTEAARLAGTTLIWQSGEVAYRLEGAPSREEAVAIARSVR